MMDKLVMMMISKEFERWEDVMQMAGIGLSVRETLYIGWIKKLYRFVEKL